MTRTMLVLCLLCACADDPEPLTWGTASGEVAVAYCDAVDECGFGVSATCAEHAAWHLCVPDATCDTVLGAGAREATDICVDAMGAATDEECKLMFYGITPVPCEPFWGYRP